MTKSNRIKTVLVDDHSLFTQSLRALLGYSQLKFEVVACAKNIHEARLCITTNEVDLLLLDLNLGRDNGLNFIREFKQIKGGLRIIILTMYDHQKYVKKAFLEGADGYVLKTARLPELELAVETVLNNEVFMGEGVSTGMKLNKQADGRDEKFFRDPFSTKMKLTRREMEILQLISQAHSTREIADQLYISHQTVSVHRKSIMKKLGVSNTIGLIRRAQELYLTN